MLYRRIENGKITNHKQSISTLKSKLGGYVEVPKEVLDEKLCEIVEIEEYESSQL